jgi:hypothetical protein
LFCFCFFETIYLHVAGLDLLGSHSSASTSQEAGIAGTCHAQLEGVLMSGLVLVSFFIDVTKYLRRQLKGGRIYFGS